MIQHKNKQQQQQVTGHRQQQAWREAYLVSQSSSFSSQCQSLVFRPTFPYGNIRGKLSPSFFFKEKRRERKKKDHDFKKEQGREREKESNLVGALGSKKDERKGTVAEGG